MRRPAVVALLVLLAGCASPAEEPTPPAEPVPAQAEVEGGTISAGEERLHRFAVDPGHGRLAVTLRMTMPVPESALVVNVTGPSTPGREADTEPFLYVYPGNNPTLSFDDPADGEWSARVRLQSGAYAAYEVHFCADDADAPGPDGNLACHRDY